MLAKHVIETEINFVKSDDFARRFCIRILVDTIGRKLDACEHRVLVPNVKSNHAKAEVEILRK